MAMSDEGWVPDTYPQPTTIYVPSDPSANSAGSGSTFPSDPSEEHSGGGSRGGDDHPLGLLIMAFVILGAIALFTNAGGVRDAFEKAVRCAVLGRNQRGEDMRKAEESRPPLNNSSKPRVHVPEKAKETRRETHGPCVPRSDSYLTLQKEVSQKPFLQQRLKGYDDWSWSKRLALAGATWHNTPLSDGSHWDFCNCRSHFQFEPFVALAAELGEPVGTDWTPPKELILAWLQLRDLVRAGVREHLFFPEKLTEEEIYRIRIESHRKVGLVPYRSDLHEGWSDHPWPYASQKIVRKRFEDIVRLIEWPED